MKKVFLIILIPLFLLNLSLCEDHVLANITPTNFTQVDNPCLKIHTFNAVLGVGQFQMAIRTSKKVKIPNSKGKNY